MEQLSSPTCFAKVHFGNEIKMISFPLDTPFDVFQQQLMTSLGSSSPINITWKDDEGDLIALKNQMDFGECLRFHSAFHSNSTGALIAIHCSIQMETPASNLSSNSDLGLPPYSPSSIDPKILKKLTKMNSECEKAQKKWKEGIEEMKRDRDFDEKEFERQMEVVRREGIQEELGSLIGLMICKELIKSRRRERKRREWREWWGFKGNKEEKDREAMMKMEMVQTPLKLGFCQRWWFSEETKGMLQSLHSQGVLNIKRIGWILEISKRITKRCSIESSQPPPKLSAQMKEVEHLRFLPLSLKTTVLSRADDCHHHHHHHRCHRQIRQNH